MKGYSVKNLPERNKKVFVAGVVIFILIIIVSIIAIFYRNFLNRTERVEIENYPSAFSNQTRENLEVQLRRLINENLDVPERALVSAVIRDGSYTLDEGEVMTANFLVDIDEYKQTFLVSMSWSDIVDVYNNVLISCPEPDLMKYPNVECIAMYDDTQDVENISDNSIYNALPIIVDDFDFEKRLGIHYEIRGYFNENNELVVVINNYSGGSYEAGIQKIKEAGYNPDDYIIKYVDQAGNF